jgi:hypothetical protein
MIARFIFAVVFVVVVIIFLLRVGVVRRPGLRAVERVVIDGWTELCLNDGSVWRTQIGFTWYAFPSGERAELELEYFLDRENDRLALLDKWSEAPR